MVFVGLFLLELLLLFFLSRLLSSSLSLLFLRITKSQSVTIYLLSFLFLPGVIIHELAHMLVASLLFVRVGDIEFLPQIKDGGVKLGSVSIAKTDPIRRAIIGFAPVLFGLGILFGLFFYFTLSAFDAFLPFEWRVAILLYIVFQIGNTMFSSKKDVEGTLELLLAVGIVLLLFYFAGLRAPFDWFIALISNEKFVALIKQANIFLLVPLLLDGVVYILTRFFVKR